VRERLPFTRNRRSPTGNTRSYSASQSRASIPTATEYTSATRGASVLLCQCLRRSTPATLERSGELGLSAGLHRAQARPSPHEGSYCALRTDLQQPVRHVRVHARQRCTQVDLD
jgi:hypothetical protein